MFLPLTGTSTRRESDLDASGHPGSCIQPELLLLVCPEGEWAMLWLVEVFCLLLSCFAS